MKRMLWCIVLPVILCSCDHSPVCFTSDSENKGQIEEEVNLPSCYSIPEGEIIILDDLTLESYRTDGCTSDTLEIDFDKYSLIACQTTGKCNLYNERQISLDPVAKTVDYRIDYTSCGICKEEVIDDNLVKIKKIDSTYTVTFDVSVD
jgi:hypothetical protein